MMIADGERTDVPPFSTLVPLLLLALVLPLSGCGREPADIAGPAEILRRMVEAEESISYEGMKDVSVRFGDRLMMNFPMVTHEAGGGTWVEYAGQPAGRSRRFATRRSRLGWLNDRELLLANYEVRGEGTETVVGRQGVVSDIRYPRPGRPRVRLVTDRETGLLLDVRMWSYRGEVTLASRFTTLLIDPELSPEREDCSGRERPTRPTPELSFTPFEPMFLPEGFVKQRSYRAGRRESGLGCFYGDGLAWIRIEQFAAKGGEPERVVSKRLTGSIVHMSMVHEGVQIRASGCLDPSALLKVLESLVEVKRAGTSAGRRGDSEGRRHFVGLRGDGMRMDLTFPCRQEAYNGGVSELWRHAMCGCRRWRPLASQGNAKYLDCIGLEMRSPA